MMKIRTILALSIASTVALPALAQPKDTADAKTSEAIDLITRQADDESLFEFTYAAPGSPVLPLVGVAGDQITRSESLRKFGFALLGGLGGKTTGQGFAIDVSPYWLLSRQAMSLADYRRKANQLARIAARTKVGLAASFGDSATSRPSSFVVSASTSLLDTNDQLYSSTFDTCVREGPIGAYFTRMQDVVANKIAAMQAAGLPLPADFLATETARVEAEYEQSKKGLLEENYNQCAVKLAKSVADKPSIDVGVGHRLRGAPGRLSQLTGSGTIVWTTFATGVTGGKDADKSRAGPLARLRVRGLVHTRFTFDDDVFSDSFVLEGRRDSIMVVAGIESAPPLDPKKLEILRWTVQAGWNRQSAVVPGDVDRSYLRYQAIASLRISDGLWANGTLGRVSGRGVKSDTQALLSLTFTPPTKASRLAEYYRTRGQ